MSENRCKQTLPGRAELRRNWLALRAKAAEGDTLAMALVIALAQKEGRRIAGSKPERPSDVCLG